MVEKALTDENQYVVFRLGRETYGLDIAKVLEIIAMQTITEVPGTEEYIDGVINLRGLVIPVFNLHKKFDLARGELTSSSRIVVVEVDGNNVGILVDGVSEVVRISEETIEKTNTIFFTIGQEYLSGVAKIDGKLVILLDLAKVLRREDGMLLENIC